MGAVIATIRRMEDAGDLFLIAGEADDGEAGNISISTPGG